MGRWKKVTETIPELSYAGALKCLFEPMPDGDKSVGKVDLTTSKKYHIKLTTATRQWSLQVIKSGQGI
jgi:hypothetical protein